MEKSCLKLFEVFLKSLPYDELVSTCQPNQDIASLFRELNILREKSGNPGIGLKEIREMKEEGRK